jgi:hypothetical protein
VQQPSNVFRLFCALQRRHFCRQTGLAAVVLLLLLLLLLTACPDPHTVNPCPQQHSRLAAAVVPLLLLTACSNRRTLSPCPTKIGPHPPHPHHPFTPPIHPTQGSDNQNSLPVFCCAAVEQAVSAQAGSSSIPVAFAPMHGPVNGSLHRKAVRFHKMSTEPRCSCVLLRPYCIAGHHTRTIA